MPAKTTWERFFDAHAPIYDDNAFTKNTVREVDFLLDELLIPPGGAVLDVGCGTGRHAIELAKRGFVVTGLDLSWNGFVRMRPNSCSPEGTMLQSVCAKEPSDFSANVMIRSTSRCPSCATSPGA
jgi:SAM-dependent methyltransferase